MEPKTLLAELIARKRSFFFDIYFFFNFIYYPKKYAFKRAFSLALAPWFSVAHL